MTTVVGDMLYSKSKLDELNRGLRQEVGESKDLREVGAVWSRSVPRRVCTWNETRQHGKGM